MLLLCLFPDTVVPYIAFEIMQSELLTEGEQTTGLMSLRQTEFFTGDEKHLKFLEGYPDVSPSPQFLSLYRLYPNPSNQTDLT